MSTTTDANLADRENSAQLNADLQDTFEFQKLLNGFRALKTQNHDTINWEGYEEQMNAFLERLYSRPGCLRHINTYTNDFAHLAPEIVYNVVEQATGMEELTNLRNVCGIWRNVASIERRVSVFSKSVFYFPGMKDRQWDNFLANVPSLHGKLELSGLCGWAGEELYTKLRPHFHDLSISYHIHEAITSGKQIKPLREFLMKQLKSAKLQSLRLQINTELQIEEKLLLEFCLSDRFKYLNWNCRPLSADFFIRVFNAFRTKRVVPDCQTQQVFGSFDRSALKEFIDALQLKPREDWHWRYNCKARSLVAADRCVQVWVDYNIFAKISVCILLIQDESYEEISSDCEPPAKKQKQNEDFQDVEYERRYWPRLDCDGNCKLVPLDDDNWREEDCEDCDGCEFCKGPTELACERCGGYHDCAPDY